MALHATGKPENWVECQSQVGKEIRSHSSPSSITLLPSVIEQIPVLLFVGDKDYICNYIGIEKMIDAMTWSGEKGLGVSPSLYLSTPFFLLLFLSNPLCTNPGRLLTFLSVDGRD